MCVEKPPPNKQDVFTLFFLPCSVLTHSINVIFTRGNLLPSLSPSYPPFLHTVTAPSDDPTDWRILSIPFGPSVVLTRSAIAIAPMKEDIRAFSPCGWYREGEGIHVRRRHE